MRTDYIIDDFQQTYFVIDSFEALLETATGISARSIGGSKAQRTSRPTS